jgi:ubiquitin-like-conjugating enzyme ATG3
MVDDAFRLFKNTREWLSPKLTKSAFLDKGVLTPEEFVRAGDHLISVCPSWSWASGEKNKLRPYLPKDKQFLTTKGVPCYRRATTLDAAEVLEISYKSNLGGSNDSDWFAPELAMPANEDDEAVFVDHNEINVNADSTSKQFESEVTIDDAAHITIDDESEVTIATSALEKDDNLGEDDSLALDDAAIVKVFTNEKVSDFNSISECGIVRSRRYDVSITYDNYYKTPRIWLFGYDENGSPLSPVSVYQDIMQDYAKKTVTIDPHPHIKLMHLSIHPCQHAAAMLRILEALNECGKVPTVDQYLFIFLKFIQSVIPTIEYDYTVAIDGLG